MAELISLADVPTIASMGSIFTDSSASLAIAASNIRAILRRTKSTGYLGKTPDSQQLPSPDEDGLREGEMRGRTTSPVMANSGRRRSVALTVTPRSQTPFSSDSEYRTYSPLLRSGSVELGSIGHRSYWTANESCTESRATSRLRSPSRGRTKRRDSSITASSNKPDGFRELDQRSNISKRQLCTQNTEVFSGQTGDSMSSGVCYPMDETSPSYITKGMFRLHGINRREAYRFPKSGTQPGSTWHIGDGFSDDEVSPEIVVGMAVKRGHKRKRSGSLSGLGKLSLETGNAAKRHAAGETYSQPYSRYLNEGWAEIRRTEVGDLWPTRENFTDCSIAHKPKVVPTKNCREIPRTPSPNPNSRATSGLAIGNARPRARRVSEFETFGRRIRRAQSRHGQDPVSSAINVPLPGQHEYQGERDKHEGEIDSLYDQVEDEIEQPTMTNGDLDYMTTTGHNFDVSYSASAYSCEDESEVENMDGEDAMIN
ncbi:hypothetical protein GGR50DRAFT_167833 [Xylaria sp. CBS 124048]|nr:hypothetical protein GGR50DRAFT_167833 [Xylaria sp. CBS 124048]